MALVTSPDHRGGRAGSAASLAAPAARRGMAPPGRGAEWAELGKAIMSPRPLDEMTLHRGKVVSTSGG